LDFGIRISDLLFSPSAKFQLVTRNFFTFALKGGEKGGGVFVPSNKLLGYYRLIPTEFILNN